MSKLVFVSLDFSLNVPTESRIISRGKTKRKPLREFSVDIPMTNVKDAEDLFDHCAKEFAALFQEVESRARQEKAESVRLTTDLGAGDAAPAVEIVPVSDASAGGDHGVPTSESDAPSGTDGSDRGTDSGVEQTASPSVGDTVNDNQSE